MQNDHASGGYGNEKKQPIAIEMVNPGPLHQFQTNSHYGPTAEKLGHSSSYCGYQTDSQYNAKYKDTQKGQINYAAQQGPVNYASQQGPVHYAPQQVNVCNILYI